jgi:methyl-accepting chemotaxis protein
MARKHWRRRYYRLLIEPRAQLKLFAPFFIFMLAWTAVIMTLAWVFHGMIGQLSAPAQSLTPDQIAKLQILNKRMFQVFMWGSGSSIALSFFFWLGFSHNVFGPIVQIHRQIKRLASGDPGHNIQLRTNDEFKHVAHSLNELTEKLKSKAS